MRQLLIGTTIGVAAGLLLGGTAVYATVGYANDIKQFSVDINSLWSGKVAVFDDADNKCYVASYNNGDRPSVAISCVKRGDR